MSVDKSSKVVPVCPVKGRHMSTLHRDACPACNPREDLLPCPFCLGLNVKTYVSGGLDYVQCGDCTACGPDHEHGRHWNIRPTVETSAHQSNTGEG